MLIRSSHNRVIVLWTCLVALSAYANFRQWNGHYYDTGFQAAEGFFKQVVLTRRWNAEHGRLYVPSTDKTRPNPYLDVPRREIVDPDNVQFTQINPAYMTRQLSELAAREEGVRFRITSLDPIRPENAPTQRESDFLERFEDDPSARGEIVTTERGESFFYMAPLITEQACLACHGDQGYEVGDVRGGISVEVPYVDSNAVAVIFASHTLLFAAGLGGIGIFFRRLRGVFSIIERQANYDSLTALLNRRALREELDREFKRSARQGTDLATLMLDIDYFKVVNDTHGHDAGDRCLREVAVVLRDHARRATDRIGRVGGEEFVVVMPDTSTATAREIAELLRTNIEQLRIETGTGQDSFTVTVSIGLASRGDDESSDSLLRRADAALYASKKDGRNRVTLSSGDDRSTRMPLRA